MAPADREESTAGDQESRDSELKDAKEEMEALEEGDTVPHDLSEWPTGKAKFLSFGNDGEPYGEGATAKLPPAGVQHHEGGSVSVGGEMVDNPEDFKGEPIPGGPTDPNTPQIAGERDLAKPDGRDESSTAGDDESGKTGQG